jgi:cytochrome c biogenesis protein CcdA
MADILTLGKITSLALADSVNPCALAVLAMVLMTILIQNPEKRKRVLLTGLAFCVSVYIGYLFYGVVIIQFFRTFAERLRENSGLFYNGLGILAMVLGGLNIKDFFFYRKGNFATEMPIWMRPKVKRIIDRITSPAGAFIIGILVTIFLLPCTIGPYIVASGLLSNLGISGALPWLLYYNLLFILPMIAITIIIYLGLSKVEDITGWKDRNIRILHLIAGSLLFLVGLALIMGWL